MIKRITLEIRDNVEYEVDKPLSFAEKLRMQEALEEALRQNYDVVVTKLTVEEK